MASGIPQSWPIRAGRLPPTLRNLPTIEYYGYILLYDFFFMLDDLIIFSLAVLALDTRIGQRYAGHFSTRLSDGSSLILTGRPGTGKTHLACAILASVIAKGYAGLFITVSEALRLIRDAYSPRAQRS